MGWWRAGEDGSSLHLEETGLVWGDGPADILDAALDQITQEFLRYWNRPPTQAELRAGILFALSDHDENDDTPRPFRPLSELMPGSGLIGNEEVDNDPDL